MLLSLLLPAVLGSCALFHPYRLPTPKPSPEFKAQQKAKKKNKESFLSFSRGQKNQQTEATDVEAASDVSTPTNRPATASAAASEARALPERPTVRYDKQGLMKKPKLMRRRRTKPAHKPFRPWKSIRHFFKYDLHAKPNYSPDHRPAVPAAAPDAPQPDAAPDDAAPAAKP